MFRNIKFFFCFYQFLLAKSIKYMLCCGISMFKGDVMHSKLLLQGSILFTLLSLFFLCSAMSYKVHLSSAWYPSKKKDLLESINKHYAYAQKHYRVGLKSSLVRSIICPHAGYEYSGNVAAAAFSLVKPNMFKRVVILAPTHYDSFEGVALPSDTYEFYKNVLGVMSLDKEMLKKLAQEKSLFSYNDRAHELEHAVNVLLPFIQTSCGYDCKLVPLLIGNVTTKQSLQIASVVKQFLDKETLLVVSSDFVHYGSRFGYEPFKQNITQQIFQLDSEIIQEIQDHNLQGFNQVIQRTGATVCGRHPIMVLLALLQQQAFGDVDSYVVGYDTSASDQKNPAHSVSYLSLVISQEKKDDLDVEDRLTGYEKGLLLKFARQRLHEVVEKKELKEKKAVSSLPGLLTKALREIQGAFVTLYELTQDGRKKLQGCIGSIVAKTPLYQSVYNMTKSAAVNDNRFNPVSKDQLKNIQISISVLTPSKPVSSYQDIELGKDGIILNKDGYSAVYLPKVPLDQQWSLEQTLSSLSQKAGLVNDAWKQKSTRFKTFQSIDFAEDKDPLKQLFKGI